MQVCWRSSRRLLASVLLRTGVCRQSFEHAAMGVVLAKIARSPVMFMLLRSGHHSCIRSTRRYVVQLGAC